MAPLGRSATAQFLEPPSTPRDPRTRSASRRRSLPRSSRALPTAAS
jgi:hypothetical protein